MVAKHEINTLISTLANNGFRKAKLLQIVIMTLSKAKYPAIKFKVKDLIILLQGMISKSYTLIIFVRNVYERVSKLYPCLCLLNNE